MTRATIDLQIDNSISNGVEMESEATGLIGATQFLACAAIGVEQTDHGTFRWFSIGEAAAELKFSIQIVKGTFDLMGLGWDRPETTKEQ
jgi:hypothetical protein